MTEDCRLHEENIQLRLSAIMGSIEALQDMNQLSVKHHNEKLEKILEQTTKTNGRVTHLEEALDETNQKVVVWVWLTNKPYRLIGAIVGVVILSRLITNEMLWEFIIKAF